MTLGRCRILGHLLLMRTVCTLLFRVMYILQPRFRLCLFACLGLCFPEVSWWSVSDLILDLIHSIIVIIDRIPRFRHFYFLYTFLDPSETTITVMVSPMMMMMTMMMMMIMSRASTVRNIGSRWALAMTRLSVKTLNPSQCPLLTVASHFFSLLLIS